MPNSRDLFARELLAGGKENKERASKSLIERIKPPLEGIDKLVCQELTVQDVRFSEAYSIEFLELNIFHGEHDVIIPHVQELVDEFHANRFLWSLVVIAKCWLAGVLYRINGQHTAWMRLSLSKDHPFFRGEHEPTVREVVYQVDTMEQLRSLYAAFDKNRPRTRPHLTKLMLVDREEMEGLAPDSFNSLVGGLRVWLYPGAEHNRRLQPNAMLSIIKGQYGELFQTVGKYYKEHRTEYRYLRRTGIIAALFATFYADPVKALEFWGPVITGVGITNADDPRLRLRHYYDTTGQVGDAAIEGHYRVSIRAWNKWCLGATFSRGGLRPGDQRPEII